MGRTTGSNHVAQAIAKINKTTGKVKKSKSSPTKATPSSKKFLKKSTAAETLLLAIEIFDAQGIPTFKRGEKENIQSTSQINNALITYKQPGCVMRPRSTGEHQEAQYIVDNARDLGIAITVKNGGYSFYGSSNSKERILMDLKGLTKIVTDMGSLAASVQAGAVWGQVYKQLAVLKSRGYGCMMNGGRCPAVGVSGFVLGGGTGPWTRSFGMGSDTVIDFTIVKLTAISIKYLDTTIQSPPEASSSGHPSYGAGHGNFGIVTEITIEVCKLQNQNKVVTVSLFTWYPHQGSDAISKNDLLVQMERFYTHHWSDQMTIDSTWIVDHRRTPKLGIRWTVYYDGNRPAVDAGLDQEFSKEQENEESSDWTPGRELYSHYESFVPTPNSDRMATFREIVYERVTCFKDRFKNKDCMASCSFIHTGGKAAQKKNRDSAYRWRPTVFHADIIVRWIGVFLSSVMENFFLNFRARLRPFSVKKDAAFYNFPSSMRADKASYDHEEAYFGANKLALRKVKQIWDEDHYFHWNLGFRLPHGESDQSGDAQAEEDQAWEEYEIDSDPDEYPGRLESA